MRFSAFEEHVGLRMRTLNKFSLTIALALLAGAGFASSALGATYYVAKTGSDANPCTQAQPCLTINRAKSVAVHPGDIVQVSPGTYNESVTLTTSGSAAGMITFQGQNGSGCPTTPVADVNHPTGKRPAPSVTVRGAWTVNASYVAIDCFDMLSTGSGLVNVGARQTNVNITNNILDGSGQTNPGGGISFDYGNGPSDYASNVYVANNYIHDVDTGFWMYCSNCRFENNEVFHLQGGEPGKDHDYMDVWGTQTVIHHNYMHGNTIGGCQGFDCHMDCIQMWTWNNHVANNITFDANVCFNHHEGVMVNGAGANGWKVINNVFAYGPIADAPGNTYHAWCVLFESSQNHEIYNNTCIGGTTGVRSGSSGVVRDNIHYDCGPYPFDFSGGSVTEENNLLYSPTIQYSKASFPSDVLNGNPNFVNVGGSNFRIQSGSAAINAAVDVGVTVDLDGNPRSQATGFDMGAYQFAAGQRPQAPSNVQATVR